VRQEIDVINGSRIQTARRITVLQGTGLFCVNSLLAVSFEHFFIRTSTFNHQYDTKQNYRIYRHMLRLVCGFILECGYDSSWNNP
jgi:hypothetical protein